nr:MAG TPA: hypothetical protein [Caudoviricetes sp.]
MTNSISFSSKPSVAVARASLTSWSSFLLFFFLTH